MTGDAGISTEKNELFKKQTIAGTGGEPALTTEQREEIAKINLGTSESDTIPSEINDLLRKQTNAGLPGYPDLTLEDRQKIMDYNASRMQKRQT